MPETQGDMYAIAISLSALATCFVGLRFHCRRKLKLDLLVDDWLIIPALVHTPKSDPMEKTCTNISPVLHSRTRGSNDSWRRKRSSRTTHRSYRSRSKARLASYHLLPNSLHQPTNPALRRRSHESQRPLLLPTNLHGSMVQPTFHAPDSHLHFLGGSFLLHECISMSPSQRELVYFWEG